MLKAIFQARDKYGTDVAFVQKVSNQPRVSRNCCLRILAILHIVDECFGQTKPGSILWESGWSDDAIAWAMHLCTWNC